MKQTSFLCLSGLAGSALAFVPSTNVVPSSAWTSRRTRWVRDACFFPCSPRARRVCYPTTLTTLFASSLHREAGTKKCAWVCRIVCYTREREFGQTHTGSLAPNCPKLVSSVDNTFLTSISLASCNTVRWCICHAARAAQRMLDQGEDFRCAWPRQSLVR